VGVAARFAARVAIPGVRAGIRAIPPLEPSVLVDGAVESWAISVESAIGRAPMNEAGDRARTGDIQLGRLALYQLSYTRARLA
jgi:hypothetical protein